MWLWRRSPSGLGETLAEARRAWDAGDYPAAAACYEQLARAYPDHRRVPAWWFNAALAHKFLRDWPKAYELGREAAARVRRGKEEPAYWNLGIAATALGEWATARDAWRGYGLSIPDGDGEIEADFGMTPIRLDPQGAAEVVWVRRICPARGKVLSVPTPESGRHFGDILLHDGAPSGERRVEGRSFPVFDELMVWRASAVPTATVRVTVAEEADLDALVDAFTERDLGAEPSSNLRHLCARCSEGSVVQHAHQLTGSQTVLLGARLDQAREVLTAWRAGDPDKRAWADLALSG